MSAPSRDNWFTRTPVPPRPGLDCGLGGPTAVHQDRGRSPVGDDGGGGGGEQLRIRAAGCGVFHSCGFARGLGWASYTLLAGYVSFPSAVFLSYSSTGAACSGVLACGQCLQGSGSSIGAAGSGVQSCGPVSWGVALWSRTERRERRAAHLAAGKLLARRCELCQDGGHPPQKTSTMISTSTSTSTRARIRLRTRLERA